MPAATVDRCIAIKMWPPRPDEAAEDFQLTDSPEFLELRRKLKRWSTDNMTALAEAKPEMSGFTNRTAANWKLLFAIADLAGGDWPKRARKAAVKISEQHSEPSQCRRLAAALDEAYRNREEMTSLELVKLLNSNPDDEWCEFKGRGAPLTQHQLAKLLWDYYEIRSGMLHPVEHPNGARGYKRSQFKDAFARFLPPGSHTRTPPKKKRRSDPMAQKQPWNWATAEGQTVEGRQIKCLIASEGHLWMKGHYDHLPPAVRQRLSQSAHNICAACLDIAAHSLAKERKTKLSLGIYFATIAMIEREIERG